jgi:hypothetical protein
LRPFLRQPSACSPPTRQYKYRLWLTASHAPTTPGHSSDPLPRPGAEWHTFATLLLEAGEDLINVSELARHNSIQVTGDIYSHVVDRTKRKAVDKLGQILKKEATE